MLGKVGMPVTEAAPRWHHAHPLPTHTLMLTPSREAMHHHPSTHPTATHPSPPGPPVDAPQEVPILLAPSVRPTAVFWGWGAPRSQPPPNLVIARPASRWHGFRKLGRAGEAQQKGLCFSCLVPAPPSHLPGGVTFPQKSLQQSWERSRQDAAPGIQPCPHPCPSPTQSAPFPEPWS